jgi:hypothetical protein
MSTLYVAMKPSVLYVVLMRNVSNIHTKIKAPVQGQHIPQCQFSGNTLYLLFLEQSFCLWFHQNISHATMWLCHWFELVYCHIGVLLSVSQVLFYQVLLLCYPLYPHTMKSSTDAGPVTCSMCWFLDTRVKTIILFCKNIHNWVIQILDSLAASWRFFGFVLRKSISLRLFSVFCPQQQLDGF